MVLGRVWVLSAPLSHSWLAIYISIISSDPLSHASQFLLLSLSHFLCVAPCASLFAILFGWFHPIKESYHNALVPAHVCLRTRMCFSLLSSMRHVPERATTSPVAMVVK